jgi:hypothetical protein
MSTEQYGLTDVHERLKVRISESGIVVELYNVQDNDCVLTDELYENPFKLERALDETYSFIIREELEHADPGHGRHAKAKVTIDYSGLEVYLFDITDTVSPDTGSDAFLSMSMPEVQRAVSGDTERTVSKTLEQ